MHVHDDIRLGCLGNHPMSWMDALHMQFLTLKLVFGYVLLRLEIGDLLSCCRIN